MKRGQDFKKTLQGVASIFGTLGSNYQNIEKTSAEVTQRKADIMAKNNKSLQKPMSLEDILAQANANGVKDNYFFKTTLERYIVQLKILDDLKKEIEETGTTVTKEYVKGRGNIYTNPAITEYNKTSTSANGTVSTLLNIIKQLSKADNEESKLQNLFNDLDNE